MCPFQKYIQQSCMLSKIENLLKFFMVNWNAKCCMMIFNIYFSFFSSLCQRQCGLLASVVCCLSSVNFSHFNLLKPISQMNWKLVGSFYGRSCLKSARFVMIHYQTWPPQAILVSDWPIFKNLLLWNHLAKWTETW